MTPDIIHDTLIALFTSDNPDQARQALCVGKGTVSGRIYRAERILGPLVGRNSNGRRRFRIMTPRALAYVRETIIDSDLLPGPRLRADIRNAK